VYSLGVMVRSTSQALLSCSKIRATRDSILKAGCSSSWRMALMDVRISWIASFIHNSDVYAG
jgi:hypothetical protein